MRNFVPAIVALLLPAFLAVVVQAQQMYRQQCVNGQCTLVPINAPPLPPLATPVKSTARAVQSIVEVVLPPYPNVQNNVTTRQAIRQMNADCPLSCPASCTCGCQEQMMIESEPIETITYYSIPIQATTQRTFVVRSGPVRSFLARLFGR